MKKCAKVLIWVVAVAAVAALGWAISRPAEPSYQGKRLSSWLEGVCGCGLGELDAEAVVAVRAIGTNAIPFLLEELQARNMPGLAALDWVASKLSFTWNPLSAMARRNRAIAGFGALGEQAAPAIPKLSKLMFGPDKDDAWSAQGALGGIGGPTVFGLMLHGLTNANLAPGSAFYLGNLHNRGHPAISALVTNLASPDAGVRSSAAAALGRIGLQPEVVVPAIRPLVSDLNRSVRLRAISTLAGFGVDAVSSVPVLAVAAADPDPRVRDRAKWALYRVQCEMRDGAIVRGPKGRRAIALAFTGHEFAEGGETILDELVEHQAKASFFLTGDFMANKTFEALIGRIVKENHLLGPHSDKHLLYCSWEADRKTLVTQEQFRKDLSANEAKISKAVGHLAERRELSPPDLAVLEDFRKRYGIERDSDYPIRYFLPPYEHCNRQIADWTAEEGMTLINFTPGTRSNADYTGEADKNFVSSQAIFDSILKKEREDPNGLNGFILLLHIGSGPGRADKFHTRFGELLDVLAAKGYQFVRVDELLEPKETR